MSLNGEGATRGLAEATMVQAKLRLHQTQTTRYPCFVLSHFSRAYAGTFFIGAYLSRLELE